MAWRSAGTLLALLRVGARRMGARWAKPLLAQVGERFGELSAIELAVHERADDLAAIERYRFGVVLRQEGVLHVVSFPRR
jgi:hypothetical protein